MNIIEIMGSMDKLDIGITVTCIMLFMVVIGMRVAFAAAIAGFLGLVWIFSAKLGFEKGFMIAVKMAGTIPHSKVSSLALSLIPAFILIGFLAYHTGLTKALFEASKRWVGWLPGGMGVSTVFSAAGFAAVSGASLATSAVFAKIAVPEMLKLGYNKRFAAGVVAASGTLASLIPPSAILVIYAIIVEQDVGALLMAGFLPGIASAFIYVGLVVGLALMNKDFGPSIKGFTWKQRFESLPGTLPVISVIAIIIICIYGGVGTPTEAGSLGVFIIFLIALYKGMKLGDLKNVLIETSKLTVMIFTIIWGVLIYVRFLGFAELPDAFSSWIVSLDHNPMITLIAILCIYAILGMFMDAIGMLLLTLPITYPAVMALNGGEMVSAADSAFGLSGPACAIWFGIIVVKMAELCLITPPIGLNCFVVASVREECSVQDVYRGTTPFFIADVVTIAVLIAIPGIVLWLPELIGLV
ncbi:MAG: TRAP transporter large permease [Sulfurovum sp.]|jgi:tripartite ATP-independent transporter DctM subunit|nr:MAG: C4-dicarboxylate TRAP transporter large permease protein DctM [Arcobacter lacus]